MADPKPLLPLLGRDPHVPKEVRLVGRYALGVDWQDGHGSIYPFVGLRLACGCPACASAQTAGAPPPRGVEATWPAEIKREGGGVRIRWQDGHETSFGGRELRQVCRCALCTGGH
ncbi:MAG: DUF971 domain-containing protein [Candidatus Rokubacteria bacterium]|nr:DUF971 domain-containing protein [Candidatus Rokubacteria bacterium]